MWLAVIWLMLDSSLVSNSSFRLYSCNGKLDEIKENSNAWSGSKWRFHLDFHLEWVIYLLVTASLRLPSIHRWLRLLGTLFHSSSLRLTSWLQIHRLPRLLCCLTNWMLSNRLLSHRLPNPRLPANKSLGLWPPVATSPPLAANSLAGSNQLVL